MTPFPPRLFSSVEQKEDIEEKEKEKGMAETETETETEGGSEVGEMVATPATAVSSSSEAASRHVVIVMDGMEEFTTEPLEWALENVIQPGCVVTLVGAMPWLNIPLSSKTWLDIWPLNFEEMSFVRGERECISEAKYAKLEAVLLLCRKYGVVPQKKVAMGHPLRLLIVEQISSLHATWVVFDKHQRSNKTFYAKKIKCNMAMLKDDGGADIIKREPDFDSTPDSRQSYYSMNS